MIETDIDEQIAIRLFGWKRCEGHLRNGEPTYYWKHASWSSDDLGGNVGGVGTIPPFSTRIGAAWLVMEKMRELGFHVELKSTEDGWFCVMSSPPKGKWTELSWVEYMANGKTAAEAICQVALKALQNG